MSQYLSTLKGKLGMLERRHFGSAEARAARVEYDMLSTMNQISARLNTAKAYQGDPVLEIELYKAIASQCMAQIGLSGPRTKGDEHPQT